MNYLHIYNFPFYFFLLFIGFRTIPLSKTCNVGCVVFYFAKVYFLNSYPFKCFLIILGSKSGSFPRYFKIKHIFISHVMSICRLCCRIGYKYYMHSSLKLQRYFLSKMQFLSNLPKLSIKNIITTTC